MCENSDHLFDSGPVGQLIHLSELGMREKFYANGKNAVEGIPFISGSLCLLNSQINNGHL